MDIMDTIKDKVEEIVEKIKNDERIKDQFISDPVSVVEKLIGIDLPNDKINEVVKAVKAKLKIDDAAEKLDGIGDTLGKLGGLFGKK